MNTGAEHGERHELSETPYTVVWNLFAVEPTDKESCHGGVPLGDVPPDVGDSQY
jgi:hypothetical protein